MSNMSSALCKSLLDHLFGVAAYTPAVTIYASLHTADPGDTGANETAYTDYTRVAVAFDAAVNKVIQQANTQYNFPQAGATGGAATHYGLWTAQSGGVFLGGGGLNNGITINPGGVPKLLAGEIVVSYGLNVGASIANYGASKLLDTAFRNQVYSPPTITIALVTVESNDFTIGTEVSGGSYARLAIPDWDAAVADTGLGKATTANTTQKTFNTATADWGNVKGQAIMEGGTSNMLFYGNDVVDQDVGNGDTTQFPIGNLTVTLS